MHLRSETKAKKATGSTNLLVLIKSAKFVEIETWHYATVGILWLKTFCSEERHENTERSNLFFSFMSDH